MLGVFIYPAYSILISFLGDPNLTTIILAAICLVIFIIFISIDSSRITMEEVEKEIRKNNQQLESLKRTFEDENSKKHHEYLKKCNELKERTLVFERLVSSKSQEFPWLAGLIADYEIELDKKIASELEYKKRPAVKAAEQVKEISRDKRRLKVEMQRYKNQLAFYESLFPWLEDFKELPPEQAIEELHLLDDEDEYSVVKNYLSPEEYNKLSSAEKWQRALDNYNSRHKTNWHVGIEYERYIGYLCEQEGYKVRYTGVIEGLEDRGRDLIVTGRQGKTYVIQCKRWAKSKLIHEKHIMQLFGSVVVLELEERKNAIGVFVTTTALSDTARHFAEKLGIIVKENFEYKEYPLIKCHVTEKQEGIYHLPFDQQYDRINMVDSRGSYYASTVEEAEANGFRHAYRWHGNDE